MRKIHLADDVVALAEYIGGIDDPALYACWCDPGTERGYNYKQTQTYAEFCANKPWKQRWYAMILRRADETPVGFIMLSPESSPPDLAIMLYPAYRGMGYGARAFALGARYCAEAFGLERIYAGCYEDNHASLKMLERCGFVLDPEPVGGDEYHYLTGEKITQMEFVKYMQIKQIVENKRSFLPLLLLADEEERYINEYLYSGDLFALYDNGLKAACVVTDEGDGLFELQNIAVDAAWQRRGYGHALVKYIFTHYAGHGKTMLVGTGDSPITIAFYESCGFVFSHRVEDYIVERYEQPIFENGVQLRDKIYLTKELGD